MALRSPVRRASLFSDLIALTATEPETRAACLAAGFDAFLIKTGDVAELERLLAGRR